MHFMSRAFHTLIAPMLLISGVPSAAQVMHASPLEANDPRGSKARALATLVGKGDRAAAARYLETNAAAGSSAALEAGAQIQALQGVYGEGGYVVKNVFGGRGADVMVVMMKEGKDPALLIVEVDQAAPHGIKAVRPMAGMYRRS
jgi:hypothetical protein